MRGLTIATTILIAGAALGALATPATAAGWCVDNVPDHDCKDYVFCFGWSYNSQTGEERCQYGYPSSVCDWIHCHWPPVLP